MGTKPTPSPQSIEVLMNDVMRRMVVKFNERGSCAPAVCVIGRNDANGLFMVPIAGASAFFCDEQGKEALAVFCRQALNSNEAETGVAGVLICHEAWMRKAIDSAERNEALVVNLNFRGGQTYVHMLVADAKTRKVEFAPYVYGSSITQFWSRFSSGADPDAGQDDHVPASPTYH